MSFVLVALLFSGLSSCSTGDLSVPTGSPRDLDGSSLVTNRVLSFSPCVGDPDNPVLDTNVYGEVILQDGVMLERTVRTDGHLSSRYIFLDDKRKDFILQCFDDDRLDFEQTFFGDDLHGLCMWYDTDGKVIVRGIYKRGKPWEGAFCVPARKDADGNTVWQTNYYRLGRLADEPWRP